MAQTIPVKEHPILFSSAMVQAILSGTKTQTRRGVKPQPVDPNSIRIVGPEGTVHYTRGAGDPLIEEAKQTPGYRALTCAEWLAEQKCPYGEPGDILWVRETFVCGQAVEEGEFVVDKDGNYISKIWYRASSPDLDWYDGNSDFPCNTVPWKPSIHMPKAAARIWLRIKSIRVERLQDISEADAKAEGVEIAFSTELGPCYKCYTDETFHVTYGNAKASFESLWESINGEESWDANPFIWVIDFEVLSKTGKPAEA